MPDQLELFTTADESRLQLTLYLRTAAKTLPKKLAANFTVLCETLRVRITELAGAGISLLPAHSRQRSRRAEQPRPGPTWGSPGLNYTVASLEPRTLNLGPQTYWVPRGAFFQINRFLLPELLEIVTANRSGQLAFDLYAGVGLFSRALATQFAQVAAVEIAESAISALAATKLTNLRAVKATTLDFLRAAVLERERPDLVVLDPPRSGAGPEVCTLLARISCAHAGLCLLLARDPARRSQNSHRLGLHPRQAAPLRPLPPDHTHRNRRHTHTLKKLRHCSPQCDKVVRKER